MRIKLFYNKSVNDNAAYYYELAKEARAKLAGAEEAIKETEKEIEKASIVTKKEVRVKKQKEWFEKFHFSYAGPHLMIGGRNSKQNDIVVSKYFEANDLFFHADIQGGAAVILKDGQAATEEEQHEAAQFTASYSKAWINANAAVDVYAVSKDQVSKHATGGFIPSGAFAIKGERKWFRGTKLALKIGILDDHVVLLPQISKTELKEELLLLPSKSGKTKGVLAKSLAKRYSVHPDELLELLPNGKSKTTSKN
ncbi:DUF814 domain-containing protein [Candidatus Micrarchaeota archaeon]|nr:DUF814 domain-containing protein [Candidatus Micrarchaeota archaeon]